MPQFAPRPRTRPALRMEELEAREVPATLYGVTTTNALVRFDSATPSALTTVAQITGIGAQSITGLDFRPSTGQLYGLGQAGSTNQLYTINATTGVATPVGATFNTANTSAISFDPVADNIKIVFSNAQQRRIDPTTGALLGFGTALNTADTIPAIAYDRHFPGTTQTTLFAYDFTAPDRLLTVGSVNGTPQAVEGGVVSTVGNTGISTAQSQNLGLTVGADNTIFLNAFVGATESLFSLNPATGTATKLGDFTGGTVIRRIAAPIGAPEPILVGGTTNGSASVFTPANNSAAVTATYTAGTAATPFGSLGSNVRTATGDVNGDGVQDFILVTGPGVPIRVAVVNGKDNTVLVQPFDPFPPDAGQAAFMNGGFVSAGDMDKDGRAEFAVSPDTSGGPRVTIYSFTNGALATRANFFTVDPNFRGGARTAIGDLNGDGFGDLAVGAGFGGGPRVQLLDGTKAIKGFANQPQDSDKLIADFFAFDSSLRDGSYLAIGDVDGDGGQDLIFGPGDGGPLQVLVVSAKQFLANGSLNTPIARFAPTGLGGDGSGARVAVARTGAGSQVNVVVGAGKNQAGVSKVYPGTSFTNGMTTEPAGGTILTNGGALADGIFVG